MDPIPHSCPTIVAGDVDRVGAQLRSGMLAEGSMAASVERRLAEYWGTAHATVTGSGTQALVLALQALQIGPGHSVLCSDYVCPEVLSAIETVGASAVLVDIGPDYFPSAQEVAAACRKRPAAIVVPYLMGLYSPLAEIQALGIPTIADCAQFLPPARGSTIQDPIVDADIVVLSFEATKLLTSGEGGAMLTNHESLAARATACKRLGEGPYKRNLFPLSDLQAALLDAQLDRAEAFLTRRREIAERYRAELRKSPRIEEAGWWAAYSCFFRYPLRLVDAPDGLIANLIAHCGARQIAVRRPVDTLVHRLRAQRRAFPAAERAYRETLSIPIYPSLGEAAQEHVIAVLNDAFEFFGLLGCPV